MVDERQKGLSMLIVTAFNTFWIKLLLTFRIALKIVSTDKANTISSKEIVSHIRDTRTFWFKL